MTWHHEYTETNMQRNQLFAIIVAYHKYLNHPPMDCLFNSFANSQQTPKSHITAPLRGEFTGE